MQPLSLGSIRTTLSLDLKRNKLNVGNRAKALGHEHIVLADFTFSRGNGEDKKGFS